jgi:hypothetical protein
VLGGLGRRPEVGARPGRRELTLTGGRGAYEFGTSDKMPGIVPQPLPEG